MHKLSSTIKSKYCLSITSQQRLGRLALSAPAKHNISQVFLLWLPLSSWSHYLICIFTFTHPQYLPSMLPLQKRFVRSTLTTHSFMEVLVLTYSSLPANTVSIPNLRQGKSLSTTLSQVKTQLQVLLEKISSHLSIKTVL